MLGSLALIGPATIILLYVGCAPKSTDDDDDGTTRIEGTEPGDCSDGADNDADGLFDCNDDGCAGAPDCTDTAGDGGTENPDGGADAGTTDGGADGGTDGGTDGGADGGTDGGTDGGVEDSPVFGYPPVVSISDWAGCAITTEKALNCLLLDGLTAPSGTFVDVSMGDYHACAVKENGYLGCFAVIDDAEYSDSAGEISDMPTDGDYVDVACGAGFCCGLQDSGPVTCWGGGWGSTIKDVPSISFTRIEASAHSSIVCGLDGDGYAHCWGDTNDATVTPSESFVLLAGGHSHACGVDEEGVSRCWGDYAPSLGAGIGHIAAGTSQTCYVPSDGASVSCTNGGHPSSGEIDETPPTLLDGETWVQTVVAGSVACVVSDTGRFDCWGRGSSGSPVKSWSGTAISPAHLEEERR